jgi:hypothetical protein
MYNGHAVSFGIDFGSRCRQNSYWNCGCVFEVIFSCSLSQQSHLRIVVLLSGQGILPDYFAWAVLGRDIFLIAGGFAYRAATRPKVILLNRGHHFKFFKFRAQLNHARLIMLPLFTPGGGLFRHRTQDIAPGAAIFAEQGG